MFAFLKHDFFFYKNTRTLMLKTKKLEKTTKHFDKKKKLLYHPYTEYVYVLMNGYEYK